MVAIMSSTEHKGTLFVTDNSKTNSVGSLGNHYRQVFGELSSDIANPPPDDMRFEVHVVYSLV